MEGDSHVYKMYMNRIILFICLTLCIGLLPSCGKGATAIYMKKGKKYYEDKNYQMAIRFFDKSLEVDSTSLDAKYYKALCYYHLGHNHFACEEMSKLLHLGYSEADSCLKKMGCFYFPEDSLSDK